MSLLSLPCIAKVKESIPMENPLPNTAGGVYVPPSKRNQPAGGGGGSNMSGSRTRTGNHFSFLPNTPSEWSYKCHVIFRKKGKRCPRHEQ